VCLIKTLTNNKFKNKSASDYRQVALIHLSCIDQGFLSSLGLSFLTLLYECIDHDENSTLIIEKKNDNVLGFVAGGKSMKTIYLQMLRQFHRLCLALFPSLINPVKLYKIIELFCFGKSKQLGTSIPQAELFSIAVIDAERGRGLAKKLYNSLAQKFTMQGESAFCIVVGNSLNRAHGFYTKMGAQRLDVVSIHKGQTSTIYKHPLPLV